MVCYRNFISSHFNSTLNPRFDQSVLFLHMYVNQLFLFILLESYLNGFLDNYIYIFPFDFKSMVQCVNTVSSYATPNQSFYVLVLYLHMHLSFLFQVFILVNYFTACYQHILTYTVINRNYCEFWYQTAMKKVRQHGGVFLLHITFSSLFDCETDYLVLQFHTLIIIYMKLVLFNICCSVGINQIIYKSSYYFICVFIQIQGFIFQLFIYICISFFDIFFLS